jgi:hypothetical protein
MHPSRQSVVPPTRERIVQPGQEVQCLGRQDLVEAVIKVAENFNTALSCGHDRVLVDCSVDELSG